MYDCEFTKQCMENMADIICPDKKKKNLFLKLVSLTRQLPGKWKKQENLLKEILD